MEKIAVCIENYSIDYSPSLINLLDCLSDRFQVHLYLRNVFYRKSHVLDKDTVITRSVRNKITFSFLLKSAKRLLKEMIKALLPGKSSELFKRPPGVSPGKIRKQAEKLNYYRYICIDPQGFLLCKELFPLSHPVYYSLELYLKDDYLGTYYSKKVMRELNRMMDKERSMIDDIRGLLIQSEEKEELFKKDYRLPPDLPTFILPVTYTGGAVKKKSDYLRELYKIDKDQYIALHLGGMNDWFSCIEIAGVFLEMPRWVLFFQGNHHKGYLADFNRAIDRKKAKNIIVSETFYDQINSLDRVLMSCNLGIAWYNDISKNFTTAGRSSGKIAAYMKFGLPTIAKRYASTTEAVEDTGCGVCVDNFSEIKKAVRKIEKDFNGFSERSFREYEKTYRFEKYRDPLADFLQS
jgi:glycosyltransferase involved in cell wall biosynthesis